MRPLAADKPTPRPRRRKVVLTTARRRLLKVFGLTVLLASLAASPFALWYSGVIQAAGRQVVDRALEVSVRAGLKVEDIYVEGRQRTRKEDIYAALQVRPGDPILAFDLLAAKQRVEALPWITEAAIERRLPGEILISVTERWPIAIWQNEGRFLLVDQKGKPVSDDVTGITALPLVVGEDAPAHAADLVAMLSTEPELMRRVKAAVRVSGRRWNLVMDRLEDGIAVRLPEENPGAAWKRLARLEREQRLLERKITTVDLRLHDRLVVRREIETGTQDKAPDGKVRKRGVGKDA